MLKTHAYLSTYSRWTANSWGIPADALATGRASWVSSSRRSCARPVASASFPEFLERWLPK